MQKKKDFEAPELVIIKFDTSDSVLTTLSNTVGYEEEDDYEEPEDNY